MLFFFVKQKTAYELRISDWSSDVCSSDLLARQRDPGIAVGADRISLYVGEADPRHFGAPIRRPRFREEGLGAMLGIPVEQYRMEGVDRTERRRSEEHTSELQSLMRISYAVFCLKKKQSTQKNK